MSTDSIDEGQLRPPQIVANLWEAGIEPLTSSITFNGDDHWTKWPVATSDIYYIGKIPYVYNKVEDIRKHYCVTFQIV